MLSAKYNKTSGTLKFYDGNEFMGMVVTDKAETEERWVKFYQKTVLGYMIVGLFDQDMVTVME